MSRKRRMGRIDAIPERQCLSDIGGHAPRVVAGRLLPARRPGRNVHRVRRVAACRCRRAAAVHQQQVARQEGSVDARRQRVADRLARQAGARPRSPRDALPDRGAVDEDAILDAVDARSTAVSACSDVRLPAIFTRSVSRPHSSKPPRRSGRSDRAAASAPPTRRRAGGTTPSGPHRQAQVGASAPHALLASCVASRCSRLRCCRRFRAPAHPVPARSVVASGDERHRRRHDRVADPGCGARFGEHFKVIRRRYQPLLRLIHCGNTSPGRSDRRCAAA